MTAYPFSGCCVLCSLQFRRAKNVNAGCQGSFTTPPIPYSTKIKLTHLYGLYLGVCTRCALGRPAHRLHVCSFIRLFTSAISPSKHRHPHPYAAAKIALCSLIPGLRYDTQENAPRCIDISVKALALVQQARALARCFSPSFPRLFRCRLRGNLNERCFDRMEKTSRRKLFTLSRTELAMQINLDGAQNGRARRCIETEPCTREKTRPS